MAVICDCRSEVIKEIACFCNGHMNACDCVSILKKDLRWSTALVLQSCALSRQENNISSIAGVNWLSSQRDGGLSYVLKVSAAIYSNLKILGMQLEHVKTLKLNCTINF